MLTFPLYVILKLACPCLSIALFSVYASLGVSIIFIFVLILLVTFVGLLSLLVVSTSERVASSVSATACTTKVEVGATRETACTAHHVDPGQLGAIDTGARQNPGERVD